MKGLRYVVLGSIAGLAASTVSARASAMCWQQQPGCATALATGISDRPVVVGCGAGNVYIWEDVTGNCGGGFCPTTFDWVQDGTLAGAQFVSVDTWGQIFVVDTSGQLWRDASGSVNYHLPIGYWWTVDEFAPPQCLNSFGTVQYTSFAGVQSELLLGTPCGSTDLWYGEYAIQQNTSYQTQTPFPGGGGAAQLAAFFNPSFTDVATDFVPWAVAQDRTLWAFDGSTWDQQPGSGVSAITDHFVVGGDGSVYEWDDGAPNALPGQAANGDWSGPVIGPTPNGTPWQIAHATDNGGAHSSLWALDSYGIIWKMQDSCTTL
jgi:hypothetical protein